MFMEVELPAVRTCAVVECSYNREKLCHARAITVGDDTTPNCDTFFTASRHAQAEIAAGVGACKIDVCSYNDDFECQAPSIVVDRVLGRPHCVTFNQR